uniref:glycoside hydrolase family 97 N-terminal domain-containing protein n=1 Tax=Enterobacter hormaechei TaxID=158836 RepID=UPI001952F98F
LRAYDDGVAFRTVVPVQPQTAAAIIRYERTGFYFRRPINAGASMSASSAPAMKASSIPSTCRACVTITCSACP